MVESCVTTVEVVLGTKRGRPKIIYLVTGELDSRHIYQS